MTAEGPKSKASAPTVVITVRDPAAANNRVEEFTCDLRLLRSTMTYFDPLIRRQQWQQQQQQQNTSNSNSNNSNNNSNSNVNPTAAGGGAAGGKNSSRVDLKVNCDISIFRWLLAWMAEPTKPRMTPSNAVSVMLSSNFLGMQDLTETALHYIKSHLADVLLSGVDMNCVPGDLLARLSDIVTEANMATALLALHSRKEEGHPNRRFITALLRHWVADRLLLRAVPGSVGGAAAGSTPTPSSSSGVPSPTRRSATNAASQNNILNNSSKSRSSVNAVNDADDDAVVVESGSSSTVTRKSRSYDPFAAAVRTLAESTDFGGAAAAADNGLRWCSGCGVLYDERELRRLLENDAAALAAPNTTRAPACRSCTQGGGGTRGGAGTTAAAAAATRRSRVGSRGEKLSTHTPSRLLPQVAGGPSSTTTAPAAAVEGGGAPAVRAALDVPAYSGGSARQGLLVEQWAWRMIGTTRYAACRRCRRLVPLVEIATHSCAPSGSGGAADFIPAERFGSAGGAAATEMQTLIQWYEYIAKEGVYAEVGGLRPIACPPAIAAHMASETIAATKGGGKAAEAGVADAAAAAGEGGAGRVAWVDMRVEVEEATTVGPSTTAEGRNINSTRPGCSIDVDVQNYYERQSEQAMAAMLSAMAPPAEADGRDLGAALTRGLPRLLSYPYVAPPTPPPTATSISSPRPQSATMLSATYGPRRAGGGSLVLGSSGKLSKPSASAKARKRSTTKRK